MNVEFKDIPGFEGRYQVNRAGVVISLPYVWESRKGMFHEKGETILNTYCVKGYIKVSLNSKHYSLHRIVAMTYILNPENKRTVNHKDGDKTNNCVDNLEWATYSENILHAFRTGLKSAHTGSDHQNSKLVLNTQTGIFYESATEAIKTQHLKHITVYAMLCGRNPNITNFIYV